MVKKLHAKGFDECIALIDANKNSPSGLFLLFSGLPWCPDCVQAEPIVEKAVESAPADAVFVHVDVGQRDFWKDQSNPFRTDARLQLKRIPTLIKYGTQMRLEEEKCCDLANVQMLFED